MLKHLPHLVVMTAFLASCSGSESDGADESGDKMAASDSMAASDTMAMSTMNLAITMMTMPDWMTVDRSAHTVQLEITAGAPDVNNGWNFNGYHNGDATITVPENYKVTIKFTNNGALAHSIGVDSHTANFPAMFGNPQPVFQGAISDNPTCITDAMLPKTTETVSFTASRAGSYSLVCYIPAHAQAGMWIHFVVSPGSAGLTTKTASTT